MPGTIREVAMTHTNGRLPVHPFTGLTALGLLRDGRPIWPVMGGDGTTAPPPTAVPPTAVPPANPATPPAQPPAQPPANDDRPLGPAGEKALQAERDARKALEQKLAPLQALVDAVTGGKPAGGKTDIEVIREQLEAQSKTIAEQQVALLRSDVAVEKKFTPGQAAELRGSTREELAAHADKLVKLFGTPATETAPAGGKPRAPKPDPAQGAQGGTTTSRRDAGKAEALKRFGKPAGAST
jgi:hypothetical protein